MRQRYVRNEPGRRETASALFVSGVLAAGVGLAAFYLTRLLLSRDAAGGPGVALGQRTTEPRASEREEE